MISLEKRVIMWKFNELDTNHNGRLSRKELNGQKKLIKKLIRPHACARQFNKYCDLDKNNDIDSREWMTCLGVDIQSKSTNTVTFIIVLNKIYIFLIKKLIF
jgi:hypothetical protein